jgi:hypothetical protein
LIATPVVEAVHSINSGHTLLRNVNRTQAIRAARKMGLIEK